MWVSNVHITKKYEDTECSIKKEYKSVKTHKEYNKYSTIKKFKDTECSITKEYKDNCVL